MGILKIGLKFVDLQKLLIKKLISLKDSYFS